MKKIALLIAVFTICASAFSQSTITFCGGNAFSGAGNMSYTCGEVAVKRADDRSITVVDITTYFTEGVQQAFVSKTVDIDIVTNLEMNLYPNPTTDYLMVDGDSRIFPLHYVLYDLQGTSVANGVFSSEGEAIDMQNYPSGAYMLKVSVPGKGAAKVYKIIKK